MMIFDSLRGPSHLACWVCGRIQDEEPWEHGDPSFAICDCCGCEFGVDDYSPFVATQYREAWLAKGASWFNRRETPSWWTAGALQVQMQNIPERYRAPLPPRWQFWKRL